MTDTSRGAPHAVVEDIQQSVLVRHRSCQASVHCDTTFLAWGKNVSPEHYCVSEGNLILTTVKVSFTPAIHCRCYAARGTAPRVEIRAACASASTFFFWC
jgi:hypothetical protein